MSHANATAKVFQGPVAACLVRDRARDPKISSLIRHSRDLRQDASRIGEGFIDVPQRTGPADAGEMEIRRRQALRDVAGTVDPDEEERHAVCGRPPQGAEAMANGFEPNAKLLAEQFDMPLLRLESGYRA